MSLRDAIPQKDSRSMRLGKFLCAVRQPQPARRKTWRWTIRSVRDGDLLGEVAWYAPWRQYTFESRQYVTLNAECLQDIAAFLKSQNAKQREGRCAGKAVR